MIWVSSGFRGTHGTGTHQLKGVHPAKSGQSQLRYLTFWSIHVNHPIWTTKSHIVCAFLLPTTTSQRLTSAQTLGGPMQTWNMGRYSATRTHQPQGPSLVGPSTERSPGAFTHWARLGTPLLTQLITALSDCLLETYGPAVDAGSWQMGLNRALQHGKMWYAVKPKQKHLEWIFWGCVS
jgi:hypothetical protein